MKKSFRYQLEAIGIGFSYTLFKILPPAMASNLGGWIGRTLGPHLAASRKAHRNLQKALPDLTVQERNFVIRGMWENLGRVFAEYPHLEHFARSCTTINGKEHLLAALETKKPLIFFSGHLANWEMCGTTLFLQMGVKGSLLYRKPNNPFADKLLNKCRSLNGVINTIPKSEQGVRDMMRTLKSGNNLGILIDQKFNKGIPVPLFGRLAMTSPAFIELAQRYDALLIPIQIKRVNNVHFELTAYSAITPDARPVEEQLQETHIMLETWIKEAPEQWLWLHRRWDSKELMQDQEEDSNADI